MIDYPWTLAEILPTKDGGFEKLEVTELYPWEWVDDVDDDFVI